MTDKMVVVFGASSRQGQAQVGEALAVGHHVRAATRNPAIFAGSKEAALEVVPADYLDPASLDDVCRGAQVVFFQPPQFGGPDTIRTQVDNVAAAAKRADVELAVYNSTMWAPDEPCGEPGYDNVLALENLFVSHGSPVVVFRPVLFMDNLQTLFAKPALVGEGVYRYCHRPGLMATWISLEDVAKFMVAAIDRPDLIGERLVIGGPERLAIEEVLAILSPLVGKTIQHEFVEPRAFGAHLADALQMPTGAERDGFIDYFDGFYTFNNYSPRTPFEAHDMDAVLKRLPVAMKPFRQWAAEQDWSVESLQHQGDKTLVGSVSG
jgi:uncharacterized protein YbjT (DUF2867 family)